MVKRNLDLLLISLVAGAGVAVQFVALPEPVKLLLGLGLVLVCPGYAITEALFPQRTLGLAERGLLTGGLSLAVICLGSVAFNAAPSGLSTAVWAALDFGVTVAASLIALFRRLSLVEQLPAARWPGLRLEQWSLLAAAGAIAVTAFILVRAPRPVTNVQGYTSLWLVPAEAGNSASVQLGIANSELEITDYHLTLSVGDRPLQEWNDIALAPGETWQQQINLPATANGQKTEALLYRLDNPDVVYRQVSLAQ